MLSDKLIEELQNEMSLDRLAKTGLFIRLSVTEENEPIIREITLHRAVLDRALIDSFLDNTYAKLAVDKWLNLNNYEFKAACERAMLDPQLVYTVFKEIKKVIIGDKAKFKKVKLDNNKNEE